MVDDKAAAVEHLADLIERMPSTPTITRAVVRPGDVIVVECDRPITIAYADNIRASLRDVWPNNKIIVLSDGLKLKIAERMQEPSDG